MEHEGEGELGLVFPADLGEGELGLARAPGSSSREQAMKTSRRAVGPVEGGPGPVGSLDQLGPGSERPEHGKPFGPPGRGAAAAEGGDGLLLIERVEPVEPARGRPGLLEPEEDLAPRAAVEPARVLDDRPPGPPWPRPRRPSCPGRRRRSRRRTPGRSTPSGSRSRAVRRGGATSIGRRRGPRPPANALGPDPGQGRLAGGVARGGHAGRSRRSGRPGAGASPRVGRRRRRRVVAREEVAGQGPGRERQALVAGPAEQGQDLGRDGPGQVDRAAVLPAGEPGPGLSRPPPRDHDQRPAGPGQRRHRGAEVGLGQRWAGSRRTRPRTSP